jgi:intein-encoded DNA endonuclease-like protein
MYNKNFNFFSEWNRDMAYVLGFITADGAINDERRYINITIHQNDVDVLEYIKTVMGVDNPIVLSDYNNRQMVNLRISSKQMYEDLISLNITQNKTYTIVAPPFIPDGMFGHYMRGYFDGDGSISIYNNSKVLTAIVSAKTASKVYAEQLKMILNEYGITSIIYTRPSNDVKHVDLYELRIAGKSIVDFAELIYTDAPFYMKRKFDKFQSLFNDRYSICPLCGKNFYRKRIDSTFCEQCLVIVNSNDTKEIASITSISSEAIRGACADRSRGLSTSKLITFLKGYREAQEDMVRSSTEVLVNTEISET